MKSRTSSYKRTWFQKNLVRFMPFWVLYTLCLLLGLALMADARDRFYYIMNLGECARFMAVINCGYALLTAQLLFGDLYNSRMCFGIHALPMRREEIFSVNILSGLVFSLVPTAIMTLCALPMAMTGMVEKSGAVPFLWFAAVNLQYVFFFSLAVFCSFCAGNRFSMAVIYGILNFFSLLMYLLADGLYLPLLRGVSNPFEWFQNFCPVARISVDPLILVERLKSDAVGTYTIQADSWRYLLLCFAAGILLLLLSLQLYRKRSLETAGEFVAVRAMKPVFLVIFAVCAAISLNLVARMFFGYQDLRVLSVIFAAAGLLLGWFVGLMLLQRTARVFTKESFTGIGILFAVAAVSMLLTHLDVLHIASWVPEPQQVESVYVLPQYDYYGDYLADWDRDRYRLTDSQDLEAVTHMHYLAIEEDVAPENAQWYHYDYREEGHREDRRLTVSVSLEYHMKNGAVKRRSYFIYTDGVAGETAEQIFGRAPVILDNPKVLQYREPASYMHVDGVDFSGEELRAEEMESLLTAISRDIEEGNLSQQQEFHPVPIWAGEDQEISSLYLFVEFRDGNQENRVSMSVFSDSVHTMQWLQQRGIVEKIIQMYQNPMG